MAVVEQSKTKTLDAPGIVPAATSSKAPIASNPKSAPAAVPKPGAVSGKPAAAKKPATPKKTPAAKKAPAPKKPAADKPKGKPGRKRKVVSESEDEEESPDRKTLKNNESKRDNGPSSGSNTIPPSARAFPPGGIQVGLSRKVKTSLHPNLGRPTRSSRR